jgi:hypothetical protein
VGEGNLRLPDPRRGLSGLAEVCPDGDRRHSGSLARSEDFALPPSAPQGPQVARQGARANLAPLPEDALPGYLAETT